MTKPVPDNFEALLRYMDRRIVSLERRLGGSGGSLADAWKGDWSGVATYAPGDLVHADDGSGEGTWLALTAPSPSVWSYVGVTSAVASSFNSAVSVATPAGTLTTDRQILILSTTNHSMGHPSGWTLLDSVDVPDGPSLRAYTRTGTTASTSIPPDTWRTVAHLWVFRGVAVEGVAVSGTITSPASSAGIALSAWTINSTTATATVDPVAGLDEQVGAHSANTTGSRAYMRSGWKEGGLSATTPTFVPPTGERCSLTVSLGVGVFTPSTNWVLIGRTAP